MTRFQNLVLITLSIPCLAAHSADGSHGSPEMPAPGQHAAIAEPAVRFDADGTARIVNLTVPIPNSVSAAAQQMLRQAALSGDPTRGFTIPLAEMRAMDAAQQQKLTEELLRTYPVEVEHREIAGVPVTLVTPEHTAPNATGRLLINVHGGVFILGKGSITEAIPIAHRSGVPVLAIDYRLAPEHPFPAAVDDTVAVYRALLETYAPEHLALYGSSAGAVLTAQAAVRARQLGLPLPAALGFFSGTADLTRAGDTEAFFSMGGLAPQVVPVVIQARDYLADNDLSDPVMSPMFSDLKGFPPTLLMTATRDFFLSATANFHLALLRAGVPAQLVVFDGMPHVHWSMTGLPETDEALQLQAQFLADRVLAED